MLIIKINIFFDLGHYHPTPDLKTDKEIVVSLPINLKGITGHTTRKTIGYVQRTKFGVGWEILSKRFNHSSPPAILRYFGIEDKEVNGILINEI